MKKVCCWGTFDLLHEGHKEFLKKAKELGDHLIVIVIPDRSVLINKKRNPIHSQDERAEAVKNLEFVDEVIKNINFDDTLKNLEIIKPDLFVFGHDQNTEFEKRIKEFLQNNKINTYFVQLKEYAGGIHTSKIIKSDIS